MRPTITLGRALCGDRTQALRREWLVTNGLGGFAAGTIAGSQTRRYHGLLVAAEKPPVGRTLLLVDLDATVEVAGHRYELAAHEYADGTVHPRGYALIESFTLDGTVPTWVYALGPARLVKRLFMARGRNTSYVTFTLERGDAPVAIEVRPLCTSRDYHWHRHGESGYATARIEGGCRVMGGGPALRLTTEGATFADGTSMHWNLAHRLEADRGLDSTEDLFSPGIFGAMLAPGATLSFTATIESVAASAAEALAEVRRHEDEVLASLPEGQPAFVRQLALAADQFLVTRRDAGADGTTVIAGYPWFSDWGRDTMIALPGLTLATGRPALAAGILRTFARHVSEGLLPNRFPDAGEAPEYNTVDATLWYFVAIHEYLGATGDRGLARELFPTLLDIVGWHRRGTRHGIVMDPADGLLRAGEPGVQLTWMDAKVGDWVVTPRTGKAVEINALWCNALRILGDIARELGEAATAAELAALAETATRSFGARFWFGAGAYLYDVIDTPDARGPDATLRPNQLLALALPYAVIDATRARAILEACERELLTSDGLRTLAPGSAGYAAHYAGGPRERDGAYHQGTVWPWLLGAFVRAHYSLYGDANRARAYLAPLEQHLADGCIGQVSEIFDAEAPFAPHGCFAQAWSVAELLRGWLAPKSSSLTVPTTAAVVPTTSTRGARTRKAS